MRGDCPVFSKWWIWTYIILKLDDGGYPKKPRSQFYDTLLEQYQVPSKIVDLLKAILSAEPGEMLTAGEALKIYEDALIESFKNISTS